MAADKHAGFQSTLKTLDEQKTRALTGSYAGLADDLGSPDICSWRREGPPPPYPPPSGNVRHLVDFAMIIPCILSG